MSKKKKNKKEDIDYTSVILVPFSGDVISHHVAAALAIRDAVSHHGRVIISLKYPGIKTGRSQKHPIAIRLN